MKHPSSLTNERNTPLTSTSPQPADRRPFGQLTQKEREARYLDALRWRFYPERNCPDVISALYYFDEFDAVSLEFLLAAAERLLALATHVLDAAHKKHALDGRGMKRGR